MGELLLALHRFILGPILWLLGVAIVAHVILSWVISYGKINRYQHGQWFQIYGMLDSIIQPLCAPIRRIVPPLGGRVDIAPLLLLLFIQFLSGYGIPKLAEILPG